MEVCLDQLLVTETDNATEQNHTQFTVTDHHQTLRATVPDWWPLGGPTAGMVVTLWGKTDGGTGLFDVDRWLELTHGSGPGPNGPYERARLLDVSAGRVPALRMVWVAAVTFLLDPQDTGDGDVHVQTTLPCPSAGLTTESTPPMRGYVDRPPSPLGPGSTNQSDPASNHLQDDPPVGEPVMILGQTRYDFGMGWWELHPIRAWRPLTTAETQQLTSECAGDPVPHTDPQSPHGVLPYGAPACTDGSEFGNPPGWQPCAPHCFVSHTAIGQLETLGGGALCNGIQPQLTPSQAGMPESGVAGSPTAGAPLSPGSVQAARGGAPVQVASAQASGLPNTAGAAAGSGRVASALVLLATALMHTRRRHRTERR